MVLYFLIRTEHNPLGSWYSSLVQFSFISVGLLLDCPLNMHNYFQKVCFPTPLKGDLMEILDVKIRILLANQRETFTDMFLQMGFSSKYFVFKWIDLPPPVARQ